VTNSNRRNLKRSPAFARQEDGVRFVQYLRQKEREIGAVSSNTCRLIRLWATTERCVVADLKKYIVAAGMYSSSRVSNLSNSVFS